MPHLGRLTRLVEYFAKRQTEATITGISLIGGAANYNGRLNGLPTSSFAPESVVITVRTTAGVLNQNAQIQIGTTNGGAELMAAFVLTGLIGVGTKHVVNFNGPVPDIDGNALLYVRMTSADTSGFASTADVSIVGRQVTP